VIVVDTSAWVEYLRGTGSSVHQQLAALVADGAEIGVPAPVLMELLAGTRPEQRDPVRRLLARGVALGTSSPLDYESAADLFQTCRAAGDTPRSLVDCLIAAVALRHRVAVLHRDRDFDVLARHAGLLLA
jgi:predicted nucleic acid-binding protein